MEAGVHALDGSGGGKHHGRTVATVVSRRSSRLLITIRSLGFRNRQEVIGKEQTTLVCHNQLLHGESFTSEQVTVLCANKQLLLRKDQENRQKREYTVPDIFNSENTSYHRVSLRSRMTMVFRRALFRHLGITRCDLTHRVPSEQRSLARAAAVVVCASAPSGSKTSLSLDPCVVVSAMPLVLDPPDSFIRLRLSLSLSTKILRPFSSPTNQPRFFHFR